MYTFTYKLIAKKKPEPRGNSCTTTYIFFILVFPSLEKTKKAKKTKVVLPTISISIRFCILIISTTTNPV